MGSTARTGKTGLYALVAHRQDVIEVSAQRGRRPRLEEVRAAVAACSGEVDEERLHLAVLMQLGSQVQAEQSTSRNKVHGQQPVRSGNRKGKGEGLALGLTRGTGDCDERCCCSRSS